MGLSLLLLVWLVDILRSVEVRRVLSLKLNDLRLKSCGFLHFMMVHLSWDLLLILVSSETKVRLIMFRDCHKVLILLVVSVKSLP